MPPEDELDPPPATRAVEAAWEAVDRAWDDPAAHRRVLALASELDALPHLAGLYRAAAALPERAETAKAQQARIVGLALGKLASSTRDTTSATARRVVMGTRVIAFAFLLLGVGLFVRAMFR